MVVWIWGGIAVAFLAAFIVAVALDLKRNWRWRIRCRDCRFGGHYFLTGLHGQGIFQFGTCERLPHAMRVVDPDAIRECQYFEKKEDAGGGKPG